jgi:hypothetical protein
MPQQLFVFIQMEFPWALGPEDGRYLMRSETDGPPESVIVLETSATEGGPAGARATKVMVIDPVSLSAEHQARAWLEDVERDHERAIDETLARVNRILFLYRITAADPYVDEVSASYAVAVRAGWGEGEQLASGHWEHAQELTLGGAARRRGVLRRGARRERAVGLARTERFAALLGARERALVCEELALRARLDLDAERLSHAAIELGAALDLALTELRREGRHDLALRIDELERLSGGVAEQAQEARSGEEPDREALAHPLERLEAALRARQLRL